MYGRARILNLSPPDPRVWLRQPEDKLAGWSWEPIALPLFVALDCPTKSGNDKRKKLGPVGWCGRMILSIPSDSRDSGSLRVTEPPKGGKTLANSAFDEAWDLPRSLLD